MIMHEGDYLHINAITYDRPKVSHELLTCCQHSNSILEGLESYFQLKKVSESVKQTLMHRYKTCCIETTQKLCESHQIKPIFFTDSQYPSLLKEIPFYPIVLYTKGDTSLLSKPSLSVVGPRAVSQYGAQVTRYFTKHISSSVCIVSGLAKGVDGIAHETALKNNGDTVAIMAHGLDICYPLNI